MFAEIKSITTEKNTIDWSTIAPLKLLVVVSTFHKEIAQLLFRGAQETVSKVENITVTSSQVLGALEIPPVIRHASRNKSFDGYLALGCVIRGETIHFDTVARESARGLTLLGLDGLKIANGILMVENTSQAMVRANPEKLNTGGRSMEALLALIMATRKLSSI